MTKTFDILSMGEPMVEFNQVRESDGSLFLRGCGGDTSNFAVAAARQGAKVGYVSAVGSDPEGALLRRLWKAEGIDDKWVVTAQDAPTGIYFVSHGEDGHQFSFRRKGSAASRIQARDVPLLAIEQAKFLHLSGISLAISESAREAAYKAIQHARSNDVEVSFDTNLRLQLWSKSRAKAVMLDILEKVQICLPSYDDIVQLLNLQDPNDIVDRCLTAGSRIVALKLGAAGAIVADKSRKVRIPPFPCQSVDATGAGDTFGGAFVARIAAGDDIEQAGRYAAVAAAISTEGYGAVTPIPTAQQVRAALARMVH